MARTNYIEALIEDGGDITIGALPPHECVATATDGSNCLAMLVRRDGESLNVLLKRLDKAIVKVVNAYNRFALPRYWGSGKSASADGTKWNVFEQNLLSEYHIRYGGYGGIGYYHVSDKYIA